MEKKLEFVVRIKGCDGVTRTWHYSNRQDALEFAQRAVASALSKIGFEAQAKVTVYTKEADSRDISNFVANSLPQN